MYSAFEDVFGKPLPLPAARWNSQNGPTWLSAAPASPASRQYGSRKRAITFTVSLIHVCTACAASVRVGGSAGVNSRSSLQ